MSAPRVSFIVPCYNLAHFLGECVNSILSQSFTDFELLIMDDCSPDNTAEVADSFDDPRVKHVRNERNLGHLANYNRGISLARGDFVWLISADDYLKSSLVLEKFVNVMDAHPRVGYVFCPSVKASDEGEQGVMEYSVLGEHDIIFSGRQFLLNPLISICCVPAPAAMVRKECYTKLGLFPLDLPHSGDWYLWCLFAMHFDVAYVAEPMVCRRIHGDNMHKLYRDEATDRLYNNILAVPARIMEFAKMQNADEIAQACKKTLGIEFCHQIAAIDNWHPKSITLDEFENALSRFSLNQSEKRDIRAITYTQLGDHFYWSGDFAIARRYHRMAWDLESRNIVVLLKYMLSLAGNAGVPFRDGVASVRRRFFR